MDKKILTDTEIVNKLADTVVDVHSLTKIEKLEHNQIFSLIPDVIHDMELYYKRLRGPEKKRLVVATVVEIMKRTGCDESTITFVYAILPDLIDSIVHLANDANHLFKKLKKKKCGFCRKSTKSSV